MKTSYTTFDQLRRESRRDSYRRTVPPSVLQNRLTGDHGQCGGPGNVLHDRTPRPADPRLSRVQSVRFTQRPANAHLVPVHFAHRLLHAPGKHASRNINPLQLLRDYHQLRRRHYRGYLGIL